MRKLAPAGLIPLLLLPNFLFLVPIAPVSAAPPSQPSGRPLEPGTVSYLNTWNQTITPACSSKGASFSEPLLPTPNNWTLSIAIPSILFASESPQSYIHQSYTVQANGALSVKDDHGNEFAIAPLLGLPTGTVTTTLRANRTYAVEDYLTAAGSQTISNVTVVFSEKYQYCQPAGLEISIKGSAYWGREGMGTISLSMLGNPINVEQSRAWFGNDSGVWLGLDWSDSLSLGPIFNATTRILSFGVGQNFAIDPSIVGTTSTSAEYADARNSFTANGRFWVFYDNGASLGFSSSTNGSTWTTFTAVHSNPIYTYSIWFNGTRVAYALINYMCFYSTCSSTHGTIYYRIGTPNSNGTISWRQTEQIVASGLTAGYTMFNLALDAYGHPWVAYMSGSVLYVTTSSSVSGTWVTRSGFPSYHLPGAATVWQSALIVPLGGGGMAFLADCGDSLNCNSNTVEGYIFSWIWSGSSWSSSSRSHLRTYLYQSFSGVGIGNTVQVVANNDGGANDAVVYETLQGSSNSWGTTVQTLATLSVSSATTPVATYDTTDNALWVFYSSDGSSNLYYVNNVTGSWSSPTAFVTGLKLLSSSSFTSSYESYGGFVNLVYETGTSNPYNIDLANLPVTDPVASLSNSWSRPGLSPYESYFSDFNEYVSPGNGLLGIAQTTLSLPGRGLNLSISLDYSQPYAFYSSSPYVYDNYTLSNVGYGWSLNLPWLGTHYLHLADGQVYLYQWKGNYFVYHGAVDFNLTKNSDGSYSLLMTDGTVYEFSSSKQLMSVTDRTGDNVISFSYGSNGYISQITDTVGRTVSFAYNSNGQLSTISSGAGTWSLGYSGGNLVTVGDPLDRTTTYEYATGINPWLISSVLYPTGGKDDYSYGSAPVGTEVRTYYVTARNTYSSSTLLSQSDSMSYYIVNGLVEWANATFADSQGTVQSHTDNHFVTSKNTMTIYEKDANGVVVKGSETDYDAAGRVNETKLLSPTGSVLATTISKYDDWGNLVYYKDQMGHETWYAYANDFVAKVPTVVQSKGAECTSKTCTLSFNSATTTGDALIIVAEAFASTTSLSWGFSDSLDNTYTALSPSVQYSSPNMAIAAIGYNLSGIGGADTVTVAFTCNASCTSFNAFVEIYEAKGLVDPVIATANGGSSSGCSSAFDAGSTGLGRKGYFALAGLVFADGGGCSGTPNVSAGAGYTLTGSGGGLSEYATSGLGYSTDFPFTVTGGSSPIWSETAVAVKNNFPDTFNTTGFSNSFFDNFGLSPNIHDALVGQADLQDGSGSSAQETYYQYDSVGNLIHQKTLHDGAWVWTNSTYDSYGNVLSVTNPDRVVTHDVYSSTYNSAYLTETWATDGAQNVTTRYSYNFTNGNLLSQIDPNGVTTSYTYDALGRQTSITYPAVNGVAATAYTYYYDNNNTMKTVDPDGHVTKAYFDGLARETELQLWNGSSAYSTVYYTYNWLDQVATKTTATGNTYFYGYDWDGRLVNLTNPDGTHELTSYNDTLNTKTVTDENGQLTVYRYNWDGLLTSVKEYNTTSTYYLATYSYDLSGNMLSATDAKGQTTTYQYDDLNRLVKTTFPDGTYETKTYDSFGNLLTRMTANGSTISYSYDALNRLILVSYPGSGGNATYTYDADGNRLSQVSPSARDYYTYDARGRLTNQTEYANGQKTQTLYAYDQAGNVVQITYPDGYVLSMRYDGVGRLNSIGRFANITYTLDGQISKIAYGNGEIQTYTYDRRDRPTQVKDVYGTTVEMELNYTYDGTGNMLTENGQSYGYDALNRLNYTSGPWGTITYTYDAVGNRVQMVNGSTVTDYTYGEFNRLTSAGNVNYTYDANGNMIAKSGGWTYSYDYENRLTAVSRNGVTVQQNYYDGDGNRVEQVSGNASTIYSYQGVNILYQKNLTSDTIVKSFYAGGIQVAQMVNYTTYYLHQDALGSTRLVMPTSMVSSFSSNYIPYGMNFAMMGSEEYQYTGKLMDVVTGLYYEGARYYDPTTGRFITEDSVVGSINDPMSLNRYVYARDNPMKIVDMNGHEWWNPVANLVSAAVGDAAGAATDVANAVSDAWSSVAPAVQSVASVAQSNFAYASQSISSGLNTLSNAATRTTQQTSVALSSIYTNLKSGFSSSSATGESDPLVKTVERYATNPWLKVAGGAGLIFVGVLRMAAPLIGEEGPVEPVPSGEPGVGATPPGSGDITFAPRTGFLSSLLESEIEGGAMVAAGITLEFSGAYQLGCQTSHGCVQ